MEELMIESDFSLHIAQAKTAKACGACRSAHTACDSKRPCSRCVSLGKPEQCTDVKMKKRGRPRKMVLPAGQADGNATGGEKRRRTGHASAPVDASSTAPAVAPVDASKQPQPQSRSKSRHQPDPSNPQLIHWTPLRSPTSPNFPSLPVPSLFPLPSGQPLQQQPSATSTTAPPLQPAFTTTTTASPSSSSSSLTSSLSTSTSSPSIMSSPFFHPSIPPAVALRPPVLPRISPIAPGSDPRRLSTDPQRQPAASAARPTSTKDNQYHAAPSSSAPSTTDSARAERVRDEVDPTADPLVSLLLEQVRELRDSNTELRNHLLDMQRRQQHYDKQQAMIMHQLDALLQDKQPGCLGRSQQPVAAADYTFPTTASLSLSSPSDNSSPMEPLNDGQLTVSDHDSTHFRGMDEISSSSLSCSPFTLPVYAPGTVSPLYSTGTPSIAHGRLSAAEILSHIPFLSCYDLDGSEYPFVVDDFRKPAGVCRMMRQGEAPILVYVNQAFCDATGYTSHELLGFPIEKISFPDYATKRSLMPFFMDPSPPMLSIHVPCRPICVPKRGDFHRVLCRHQVLYNTQGKAVWIVLCVDGVETGRPSIESTLPPETNNGNDPLESFTRGVMSHTYERAFQFLNERGASLAKAVHSPRLTPLLENASLSSDGETSDSADPSSPASTSPAPVGPPLPISPLQPPSPLYSFSPYPASPSADDYAWLLRNDNAVASVCTSTATSNSIEGRKQAN